MARCAGKRLPRWQAVSRPAASWNVRARAESDRRRHGAGVCRLVLVAGARFESWWTIVRVAPCPSPDAGSDAGDGPCRGRPSGRSGDGRLNMRLQDLQSWPLCCGGAKATSCQTSGRRRARRPVSASSHRGRGGGIEMAQGGGVRVAVGGDSADFPAGAILVARTTSPAWTPLFHRCAGVIMEGGVPLSHGAVTAREIDIPAVMSVRHAMHTLATGDRVRIDGTRGLVQWCDRPRRATPRACQPRRLPGAA